MKFIFELIAYFFGGVFLGLLLIAGILVLLRIGLAVEWFMPFAVILSLPLMGPLLVGVMMSKESTG